MPRKKRAGGETLPEREVPPSRDMPVTADTVRTPAILEEIKEYAVSGCTMQQIARRLLVTAQTLYNWSKKFPEVKDVLLEGKRVADDRVEQSLYDMCFGYDVKEVTIEKDSDNTIVKQVIKTRHIPPNVTAIQYWLQNRRNDDWKSHQSLEVQGKSDVPITIVYDLDTKAKPTIKTDAE